MFVRMESSCFITNIRHFYVLFRKCSEDAEDVDVRELCGSAPPHPVRCPDYVERKVRKPREKNNGAIRDNTCKAFRTMSLRSKLRPHWWGR